MLCFLQLQIVIMLVLLLCNFSRSLSLPLSLFLSFSFLLYLFPSLSFSLPVCASVCLCPTLSFSVAPAICASSPGHTLAVCVLRLVSLLLFLRRCVNFSLILSCLSLSPVDLLRTLYFAISSLRHYLV
eukprot:GILK01008797.1.p1 GENE.GILK01008797.1~~GILK01008797.1.p1  ORF type:complete len:128 (-),score=9.63 GILK01008797.1:893-1276(-)